MYCAKCDDAFVCRCLSNGLVVQVNVGVPCSRECLYLVKGTEGTELKNKKSNFTDSRSTAYSTCVCSQVVHVLYYLVQETMYLYDVNHPRHDFNLYFKTVHFKFIKNK